VKSNPRVCSFHFICGKKSNNPLNPDYVQLVKYEMSDGSNDDREDKGLARGKCCHAGQVTHQKKRKLEEDI